MFCRVLRLSLKSKNWSIKVWMGAQLSAACLIPQTLPCASSSHCPEMALEHWLGSWPSFRKSRAGWGWRPRSFGGLCGILGSIPEHSGSPRDQKVGLVAGSQTQASVHSQAGWRHQSRSTSAQWVCRRLHRKPHPTSFSGHFVFMWVSRCLICMNIWDPFTYPPLWASQVALVVKNLPTKAGDARDASLVPGLGR